MTRETFLNKMHQITGKVYMTIGGGLGAAKGFLSNHFEDIFVTLLLGFFGALGAGLAKLAIDWMLVRIKRGKTEPDQE